MLLHSNLICQKHPSSLVLTNFKWGSVGGILWNIKDILKNFEEDITVNWSECFIYSCLWFQSYMKNEPFIVVYCPRKQDIMRSFADKEKKPVSLGVPSLLHGN